MLFSCQVVLLQMVLLQSKTDTGTSARFLRVRGQGGKSAEAEVRPERDVDDVGYSALAVRCERAP